MTVSYALQDLGSCLRQVIHSQHCPAIYALSSVCIEHDVILKSKKKL